MHLSKWVLLAAILLMVIVLGFFLPPVSIILMTAPIILPPLKAAGFDLIWFGVLMTIVMEMGLIHPPVGLNIFVIKNIAPDIPLRDVIWGVMPFVGLMFVAVVLICFFPGIATGLPDAGDGSEVTARAIASRAPGTRSATSRARAARRARRTRLGARCRGKVVRCRGHRRPAGGGDRARRPRLPRRQQPEAGRLSGARRWPRVDPARVHDLHMVQSVLALPEHLDVFERGIATRLDFSFSGPQARAARAAGRATGASRSARSTPISSCSAATSST